MPVSVTLITDADVDGTDVDGADVDDADTDTVGSKSFSGGHGESLWSLLHHSGLLISLCPAFC